VNARTRCISTERPQGIAQETERPASNAGRGNCQYPTPAEVGLVTDPLTVFMIGPRHVGKCGSGGRSVPSSPLYCRSCLSLPPAVATNSLSCLLSRHAGRLVRHRRRTGVPLLSCRLVPRLVRSCGQLAARRRPCEPSTSSRVWSSSAKTVTGSLHSVGLGVALADRRILVTTARTRGPATGTPVPRERLSTCKAEREVAHPWEGAQGSAPQFLSGEGARRTSCSFTQSQLSPSWSRRRVRYATSALLPASSMAFSYAARASAERPSRRNRSAQVAW